MNKIYIHQKIFTYFLLIKSAGSVDGSGVLKRLFLNLIKQLRFT